MNAPVGAVNFKSKGMNVTINCAVPKFDGSKSAHTATAVVTGRTLNITASVEDKNYGLQIDDVDLQTGTKVERGKGQIIVTVVKTKEFDLEEKYSSSL